MMFGSSLPDKDSQVVPVFVAQEVFPGGHHHTCSTAFFISGLETILGFCRFPVA